MDPTDDDEVVKDIEVVSIEPAGDDEELVETEDTDPESTQEETEGEPAPKGDEEKPEPIVAKPRQTPPAVASATGPEAVGADGLVDVPGETPRERALRREVTQLKRERRQERVADIVPPAPVSPMARREPTDAEKAVLGKYKPEELASLQEVLPVLAKQMGFVRADELAGANYTEKSQDALNSFLDKHPEYLPENDKDGTLWGAFKSEYNSGIYQQPKDPKDFQKIFERVHRDVFGIKPAGALTKVTAQREKVSVASHAGASSAPTIPSRRGTAAPQGLRLDMLKGFSEEDLADMAGGE